MEEEILANGRVDGPELEKLRQHRTPAFGHFFYQDSKDHVLIHGKIGAEEAAWLRELLFADDKIDDRERKFLHELKGEARDASGEFEALLQECMNQPLPQHTCG
jgi:hypothetical protein